MSLLRAIRFRVRALSRKRKLDAEMDEEMRFHLDMQTRANIDAGMDAEEARYAALRKFGWVEKIKETAREERGVRWLETFVQDIRYGVRILLKNPGFTAVAVLTLALGIGASSSAFSFVRGLWFNPFQFPRMDRLVTVWVNAPKEVITRDGVPPATFRDVQSQTVSYSALAAYDWWVADLSQSAEPARVTGARVTPEFFNVVGLPPKLGRVFGTEVHGGGEDDVVVLSYGLWQRSFGGDRGVLNSTVRLDGRPYTVVGVMPEECVLPMGAEFWTPLVLPLETWAQRKSPQFYVAGRLKAEVTFAQAQSELRLVSDRLAKQFPDTHANHNLFLISLRERLVDYAGASNYLFISITATVLVLLLACANVAILQLARGATRLKEIAIRMALGAGRRRIIDQLLIESLALAFTGGALGLLVADWSIYVIKGNLPAELIAQVPGSKTIGLNGPTLAFTLVLAAFTGIFSGMAPALAISGTALGPVLKEAAPTNSGRQQHALHTIMVVSQVALALVLVIGAVLLAKSLNSLVNQPLGFNPIGVLTMNIHLPKRTHPLNHQVTAFCDEFTRSISLIPSVKSVAAANSLPFVSSSTSEIHVEGTPPSGLSNPAQFIGFQAVSPSYFGVMEIPLVRGRTFSESDTSTSLPTAVVSEAVVRRYWPNEEPLGRRIQIRGIGKDSDWFTVVGVVGDVERDWFSRGKDGVYVPLVQVADRYIHFIARTDGSPTTLLPAIRAQLKRIAPDLALLDAKTVEKAVFEPLAGARIIAGVVGAIALIALSLSTVGIYSVMAYSVSQRTHEIGVRMALGAQRVDVVRLILAKVVKLAAVGLVIGVPAAIGLSKVMASQLQGLVMLEPIGMLIGALALAGSALLAGLVPTLRATKVDPLVALRYE